MAADFLNCHYQCERMATCSTSCTFCSVSPVALQEARLRDASSIRGEAFRHTTSIHGKQCSNVSIATMQYCMITAASPHKAPNRTYRIRTRTHVVVDASSAERNDYGIMTMAEDTDPRKAPPSGRVASDNGMRAVRMRQPCSKLSQNLHAELSVQRPSCLSSNQSGPALLPSPYHQWIQLCCPCIAHLQAMFLPRCCCHTHGVRWGKRQVQNDALPGL